MPTRDESVPDSWFQELYARDPDPWRFSSSPYEKEKYATTLAAIGDAPIGRAWEIGCSIGVFTQALAVRCADLLAVDVAEAALDQARLRGRELPWVRFACMRIPRQWPSRRHFDLIVLSEVLYFLTADDVRLTVSRIMRSLAPGGRVVLVNWTGETGHALSGDDAASVFHDAVRGRMKPLRRERRVGYRLDLYCLDSGKQA